MSEDDSVVRRRISEYTSRRERRSWTSENQSPTSSPSSSRKASKEALTPITPDRKSKKKFSFDLSTPERTPSSKPLSVPQYRIKIQTEEDTSDTEEMNKDSDIKDAVFVTEPTTPLDDSGKKKVEKDTVAGKQKSTPISEKDASKNKESSQDSKNKDSKGLDTNAKSLGNDANKTGDDKKSEGMNKEQEAKVAEDKKEISPSIEPDANLKEAKNPSEPLVPKTPTYSMTSLSDEDDFDRLEDAVITENGDDEVVVNDEESGEREEGEGVSEETFFDKYGCVLFYGSLISACVAVIAMYLNKSQS